MVLTKDSPFLRNSNPTKSKCNAQQPNGHIGSTEWLTAQSLAWPSPQHMSLRIQIITLNSHKLISTWLNLKNIFLSTNLRD